ncbi:MAG: hypothetical protein RMX68_033220 [Aulosira sp. ZfuVER01]|nr:hypothetical protein [Aulosira sp. ZfuVER01]MDZ7997227.1 hypothetical protein [Aulosira sp. DedVER01a]MDZ8056179.1 hypothetical protein [Aulosira sp. ZfuCHP01]
MVSYCVDAKRLVCDIATLWQVSVGGEVVRSCRLASESNYRTRKGEVDANLPISSVDKLPPTHVARRNFKNSFLHRCLSCFRCGFLVIKAAVLNRLPLPIGGFFPEPWPNLTPQINVFQITLSTA